MASDKIHSETDHLVELIVRDEPPTMSDADQIVKPKINIFTISYPRRKPSEQVNKLHESDASSISQSIIWIWGGSRYSGLLCASLSSIFYFAMEVLMDIFSAQSIPILEMAFSRCTIITILSYLWLRRNDQPMFGQTHVNKLLVARALSGLISLMGFIYSIQSLPLSQAIVLSFITPILASVMARFILHEKLKFSDFGGLACSFLGVLLLFQEIFSSQVCATQQERYMLTVCLSNWWLIPLFISFILNLHLFPYKAGLTEDEKGITILGSHHVYAILIGLLTSIAGGISFCLIRASAKASDQPVVTVLSFGMLAGPVTGICSVVFETLVLPNLRSFLLMLVLGLLAFLAEVCWARGLQLEKTSKVCNIIFMEAALVQIWHFGILRVAPYGQIFGIILILISQCWTLYVGPDTETE